MVQAVQVSIDGLLSHYLAEYVNRGFAVRDALVRALADVAREIGLPSIELSELQFETLAKDVEARIEAYRAAQDQGLIPVAPGVGAQAVEDDEYRDEMAKRNLS